MNFWWCNQRRCWDIERPAGVVCSSEDTGRLTYRKTVGQVRAGDIVIHYRLPNVVALSRALGNARHYRALPLVSREDYGSGWRFRTEYFDLQSPVHKEKFAASLVDLIVEHYPVDRNANVRQGYFFPFNLEGTRAVLDCVDEPLPLPVWLSDLLVQGTPAQSSKSRKKGSSTSLQGGGFGEPEQNAKVERAAVKVVTKWYKKRGWKVKSVEDQRRGFDLLCRRDGAEEHVEVKGTSGNDSRFIITAGELRRAEEDNRFVLALVRRALSRRPVVDQWAGDVFCQDFELDPVQYWARKRDA